jgi:hypothetical protein
MAFVLAGERAIGVAGISFEHFGDAFALELGFSCRFDSAI